MAVYSGVALVIGGIVTDSSRSFSTPASNHLLLARLSRSGDEHWGGKGYIAGRVTIDSVNPVSRRVRLFDLRTGMLAKEVWSDVDGNYRFDDVSMLSTFFVLTHDHLENYNAVVADRVTAVLA